MGDFNIDLLKSKTDKDVEEFLQTNYSQFFKPTIVRPTRVTPHSKTLIDNIFTNSLENINCSGNIISSISDHLPQYLVVDNNSVPKPKKAIKFFRDYKSFDKNDFLLDYISIPWDEHFANKNASKKIEKFINLSNEIIDIHAPIKSTAKKSSVASKPWLTKGLLKSIETKNNLYKKFCHKT